jgi:DNA-binding NarL/FixJ family response regulator
MIDVMIADHHELFNAGVAQVLAGAADVRLVVQLCSPEELLTALQTITPNVLILSTSFLPSFPKIEPMLKRGRTALLLLAEDNDRAAYVRWLRAQGIIYRSIDGPVLIDAMRRVARGELFVQGGSSDLRKDPSEVV